MSRATSLHRAAMTGLIDTAREVREQGTFGYFEDKPLRNGMANAAICGPR